MCSEPCTYSPRIGFPTLQKEAIQIRALWPRDWSCCIMQSLYPRSLRFRRSTSPRPDRSRKNPRSWQRPGRWSAPRSRWSTRARKNKKIYWVADAASETVKRKNPHKMKDTLWDKRDRSPIIGHLSLFLILRQVDINDLRVKRGPIIPNHPECANFTSKSCHVLFGPETSCVAEYFKKKIFFKAQAWGLRRPQKMFFFRKKRQDC